MASVRIPALMSAVAPIPEAIKVLGRTTAYSYEYGKYSSAGKASDSDEERVLATDGGDSEKRIGRTRCMRSSCQAMRMTPGVKRLPDRIRGER
jgi:hypothetical protein